MCVRHGAGCVGEQGGAACVCRKKAVYARAREDLEPCDCNCGRNRAAVCNGACRLCTTLCNWVCVTLGARDVTGKLVPPELCGVGLGVREQLGGVAGWGRTGRRGRMGAEVTQSQAPRR